MPELVRFAPVLALVVGGLGALGVACSALVDLDGLAGPADAASSAEGGTATDGSGPPDSGDKDSTTTDATTDAAADADTHLGPNLLDDSSFEDECTWNGYQGTRSTDSTARTGTKSCRICTAPLTTDYFTGNSLFTAAAPVVGATYHAVAWVRAAPGAALPPGAVLNLRTLYPSPFTGVERASTSPSLTPLTDTWQRMEITLAVTKPAAQMDGYVGSDTAPGACFLVDDVWLEKLP